MRAAQSLEKAATDLASLKVPLGWADPERTYFKRHSWRAFVGWFLTGLAASMGATFGSTSSIDSSTSGRTADLGPVRRTQKTLWRSS
jgi:hypothetical protein